MTMISMPVTILFPSDGVRFSPSELLTVLEEQSPEYVEACAFAVVRMRYQGEPGTILGTFLTFTLTRSMAQRLIPENPLPGESCYIVSLHPPVGSPTGDMSI